MRKLFETASSSEKNSEQVDKIAKAPQVLRWSKQIVEAKRAQMQSITQIADPNYGSHDGRSGGDQITESKDRLAVGVAVEAKVLLPSFGQAGS